MFQLNLKKEYVSFPPVPKVTYFIAACLFSFLCCTFLLITLPNGYIYSDIVAGPLATAGIGKSLDYKLFYAFIILFGLFYVGLLWLKLDTEKMLYAFLPLSWVAARLFTGQFNHRCLIISAIGLILVFAWEHFKKMPRWWIRVLQIPLPLLWFDFLPHMSGISTKPTLFLLLVGLAVIGWWNIWRQEIAPFAILPLLLFLVTPVAGLPLIIADDYHFGEAILPWQQWKDFGKLPYVDYNHVHGLIHFVQGAINFVFYGPDLTTLQYAAKLQMGLSIGFFFLAMTSLIGIVPATLIIITGCFINLHRTNYWGEHYALMLIPAFLCLLARPHYWNKPLHWLMLFSSCAVGMVFYRTTHGIAFALAGLPFAFYQCWRVDWRNRQTQAVLGGIFVVLAGLLLFTPLGNITLGLLRYVYINNGVNNEAWGLSWVQDIKDSKEVQFVWDSVSIPEPIWQFLRLGWIPLMLFCGCVFVFSVLHYKKEKRSDLIVFAGMLMLYLFWLHPYSLGRFSVDVAQISTKLSVAVITTALPILLTLLLPKTGARFWLAMGFVAAFYQSIYSPLLPGLYKIPRAKKEIQAPHSELAYVGGAAMNAEHQALLTQLDHILKQHLKPGELFWDIHGHNAAFAYLKRPVPMQENALYNIVGEAAEADTIHALETQNIAFIWAQKPILEYAPISLRQSRIHAYLMQHYALREIDGQWFLVKNERAGDFPAPTDTIRRQQLAAIFKGDDLGGTAISWGQSISKLEHFFVFEAPASFSNISPKTDQEWLLLEVTCTSQQMVDGYITSGGKNWQKLKVKTGPLLVSLAANSQWYERKGMNTIGFSAQGCNITKSQLGNLKPIRH